jgi:Helix-turn-helix.
LENLNKGKGMMYIDLKELRINAGLTQEAAAKMLDLEQSAISHW